MLAVILIVMAAGAVTALLAFASPLASSDAWDRVTHESIAQARTALIGRAAMDDNRPGSLPCPDTNNDGIAELLIGDDCPSYIGRLPWRTLGLPDLRDSSGERLWYALSVLVRDSNAAQPLNTVTAALAAGVITLNGTTPATDLSAVIIAPGAALSGQTRTPGNENTAVNYLEGENSNGGIIYESAAASATFNDRVGVITRQQLFNVVEWRVANEIRNSLQKYYTTYGYFPFANDYPSGTTGSFPCKSGEMRGRVPNPNSASISSTCTSNGDWGSGLSTPPPAWFFANNWHLLTYYALAPACTFATPACTGSGFLSVNGVSARQAVIIVGSGALTGQVRPCNFPFDCIEQPAATIDQYQRLAMATLYNDKVAVIP